MAVTKTSRPVSIIITQVLMALTVVLLVLGVTWSLVRALMADPASVLSPRALGFLLVAYALSVSLAVFGCGGLWKRKKYGYWLGVLLLVATNAKNFHAYVPRILSAVALIGREGGETAYKLLGYRFEGELYVDLAVQSVLIILLVLLLAKVAFGRRERAFFGKRSDGGRA